MAQAMDHVGGGGAAFAMGSRRDPASLGVRLDPSSSAGITAFFWAAGSALLDWNGPDVWLLLSIALPLPFVAAGLWGRQYGAGIVAAAAALWILPAAAVAGVGYVIYLGLERGAKTVGLR